jgi:hypothetical protein
MEERINPLKIEKDQKWVLIYTPTFKIVGYIHLPVNARLTDTLNYAVDKNPFIPVTNAHGYSISDNKLCFIAEFLSVNKRRIDLVLIEPEERQGGA